MNGRVKDVNVCDDFSNGSDVKSIIILYDNIKVFERHHVALEINNRLH